MTDRSGTAASSPLPQALREAMRLHEIEGNPLDQDDVAMFAMFEREQFTPEQRRAFIIARAKRGALAAE